MKVFSSSKAVFFILVCLAFTATFALTSSPPSFGPRVSLQTPAVSNSTDPGTQNHPQIASAYGKLPLSFIANHGQLDSRVRYYQQSGGQSTYFTQDGVYLGLLKNTSPRDIATADLTSIKPEKTTQSLHGQSVKLTPLGMNPQVQVNATDQQPGKVNYFMGNDPEQWQTDIPTFGAVVYQQAYPGIDLKFYGNNRQMEYDVVVSKGADPEQARFEYSGIKSLVISESGELKISLTDGGTIEQKKPIIYQDINGQRMKVDGKYKLFGQRGYGFEIASYDPEHTLVIDPVLTYSTYLGGADIDIGYAIGVDAGGNAYVTGTALSEDFPVTVGAFNTSSGFVFVTKLNAAGTALVYSTFLDGGVKNRNAATGIAVDSFGNAYLAGTTTSNTLPTTPGAFDRVCESVNNNFCADAFVSKLNATGNALIYSTYLGGDGQDIAYEIGVDSAGNAYLTGSTNAANFPTTAGAFSATLPGSSYKNFVSKLNAAGTGLSYSTYLGYFVTRSSLAVDAAGNAYITTTSLPTLGVSATPGAFDTTQDAGSEDGVVAKLNPAGSALVYATYLGGSSGDSPTDIAVDASGNAYITGGTFSGDFPTTPSAYQTPLNRTGNGFLTKLNPTGNALIYSSFLGGGFTSNRVIGIDSIGNATVANNTTTPGQPAPNGFDSSYNGEIDIFIQQLNASGSALVYASYLGGSQEERIRGIAVDPNGSVYLTGSTLSANFPTTAGAFDRTLATPEDNLIEDAFISKISASLVQFSAASYSVSETSPSVTISVTRSGIITNAVSVNYATSNGTALAPSDYTTRSGTLTWAAGDATPRTFTIPISSDTAVEGNETVNITLGGVSGAVVGTPRTVVLTILDDDSSVQFSNDLFAVSEDIFSAEVTVTRSGGLSNPATVNFSTSDGSALAGSDYTATQGTLSFAPNETSKSFFVPITDDAQTETTESVNLTLSAPTGGAQIGAQATTTLIIRDNDATQLSFRTIGYDIVEGQPSASITVLRQGTNMGDAASVSYATTDDSATAGADYTASSGILNFAPGQISASFSVPIADDSLAELNERVKLSLSDPVGASLGAMPSAVLVIRDNEPTEIRFRALVYAVSEGTPSALITAYRLGNLAAPSSVNYATSNNTAVAGADYTATSGILNFAANDVLQSFSVPITDDALPELNERVNLNLSNPVGAVLVPPASAILVITSNE